MPVSLLPGPTPEHRTIKFVLPVDVHDGPVSVVGDFNAWQPGTHVLRRRSNATRSVRVLVPAGTNFKFRYLGDGGHWFDDPVAPDHVTA